MFDLAPQDLDGRILDCAAGPASFNAEATQMGYRVTSCDPIYRFTAEEISNRIDETYHTVVTGVATFGRRSARRNIWARPGWQPCVASWQTSHQD
jgi:hypothetical protein